MDGDFGDLEDFEEDGFDQDLAYDENEGASEGLDGEDIDLGDVGDSDDGISEDAVSTEYEPEGLTWQEAAFMGGAMGLAFEEGRNADRTRLHRRRGGRRSA